MVAVALALGGCGSKASGAPTAATYGSSWGQFSAAFPSTAKPATATQMLEIGRQFPHVSESVAFYVSPSKQDIFAANSDVPPPPTDAVLVMRFTSASDISTIMSDLQSHLTGVTKVTVNGNAGLRILGPTSSSPFAQGTKITDKNTFLGALLLQHGNVLYEAESVTTSLAEASSFLSSIKPLT
ncbi:MAG: hypothetical protein ABSD78_14510 [Acidimicrobiales bacterium]